MCSTLLKMSKEWLGLKLLFVSTTVILWPGRTGEAHGTHSDAKAESHEVGGRECGAEFRATEELPALSSHLGILYLII